VKLARKLTLALVAAIFVVMAAYAYVQTRHEVMLFDVDVQRSRWFGRGTAAAIEEIWQQGGEARAMELLETISSGNPAREMRWVWLDAPVGDPRRPDISDEDRRVLATGGSVTNVREMADGLRRFILVPMSIPGSRPAAVEYSENLEQQRLYLRTSHRGLVVATSAIALICGLIALWLGHWLVGRPVGLLRDKARKIAAGDFSGSLALRQRDEIGELAAEIDAMSDRIREARDKLARETEARTRAVEQLHHADRLATAGQLASGVAHELGTPLNVIAARGKMIAAANAWTDAVRQNGRIITEQAERMSGIIRQLLDLSRQRRPKLGPADLRSIVSRTLDLVSSAATAARVNVIVDGARAPVQVEADQNQLEQALTNLVLNGIQAMPDGGRLTLSIDTAHARPPANVAGPAGQYVVLTVADEGIGIPPENLPHIFEPFFTTREQGTGLGLAITHEIVRACGGSIRVEGTPGGGATFVVELPAAEERASSDRTAPSAA